MGRILAVQETESTANLRYSLQTLKAASQMGYSLTQEDTRLGYVPSSEHSEQSGEQGWRGTGSHRREHASSAILSLPG